MGWLADVLRYRDERYKLIQLRYDFAHNAEVFRQNMKAMDMRSPEYQSLLGDFSNQADLILAEIAEIETEQMLRRAERWRVAYSIQPYDTQEDTEIWTWHSVHGCHYLNNVGLSRIRREIYQEWEMWSKPWLSWMAIGISLASLAIAVFKP